MNPLPLIIICIMYLSTILIHEAGHLMAARLCHVPVENFSVGFGKSLFQKQDHHGTVWNFRVLLLGGFCRPDFDEFNRRPWYQKLFINSAGISMNVLLGLAVSLIAWAMIEVPVPAAEITAVDESSLYAEVLYPGDQILEVNGTELSEGDIHFKFFRLLYEDPDQVHFKLERDGNVLEIVAAAPAPYDQDAVVTHFHDWTGLTLGMHNVRLSLFDTADYVKDTFNRISMISAGRNLSGEEDHWLQYFWDNLMILFSIPFAFPLAFWAVMNFYTAGINLIPFPGLDGASILGSLLSGLTRLKLRPVFRAWTQLISKLLLMTLVIYLELDMVFSILSWTLGSTILWWGWIILSLALCLLFFFGWPKFREIFYED